MCKIEVFFPEQIIEKLMFYGRSQTFYQIRYSKNEKIIQFHFLIIEFSKKNLIFYKN